MKTLAAVGFVLGLTIIVACGGPGSPGPASDEGGTIDTLRISVVDTIGVMMGDSSYVFGNVTDATRTPDGEIYVLDGLRCRLSVYSPEGIFQRSVGRKGSGPGEYQYPKSFALMSDGSVVICDWGGISVTHLTPELEFDTLITGYRHIAPDRLVPFPDGSYVGMTLRHSVENGQPVGSTYVARFDRSTQPELVYCGYPMTFSLGDDGDLNVHTVLLRWDTGPDGSVYVAIGCDSVWAFTGYGPEGDTLVTVFKPWERVAKTEEELEEGLLHESLSTGRESGTSVNRDRRYENVPRYHNAIGSIDVDDQGRIWVGRGWTDVPTFDVYSPRGNLLFVATVPALEDVDGLSYCFDNGYLAFDEQPEDYPKVYLLRMGRRTD
ncbi:6-bladed beta-propeller [Candidatus Fermentibacteria bacterium]|nr:6-bladed beta-propeller [Candidatus Fermentibacteria bacterium]